MPTRKLLISAALRWHESGLLASPRAGSVQLTQVFVEALLEARQILGEVCDDLGLSTRVPKGELEGRILQFLADTSELDTFKT